MRGEDNKQSGMFSYVRLERRVPQDHPLRRIRVLVDRALERMEGELEGMYSAIGRPSIAPERLLRALLLQVLYSVRSERQLMEQLGYNLLFRWFVGLEMDDEVWSVTVFTKNRERLIRGAASQHLLGAVLQQAGERKLLSEEHFTVDGTLLQAWASARSFQPKANPPKSGQGSGGRGEVLLRDKVESSTDPEARLFRKSKMDKSLPSYLGHALMENRNGLIVAAQVSLAASDAERQAAVEMLDRVVASPKQRKKRHRVTLGADTGYQEQQFVEALRQRKVAPHIAEYENGNLGKNSLTGKEKADKRRRISQNKRKWIERVFGWGKLDRPLRQFKLRGLQRVDWFYRLAITAYDLTRMSKLIPLAA
jgi:transposase